MKRLASYMIVFLTMLAGCQEKSDVMPEGGEPELTTVSIKFTVLVFKTVALFRKQKSAFTLRPKCKCVTCTFPQATDSLRM